MQNNWNQVEFNLKPRSRGFHLITHEILDNIPEISTYNMGWVQLFIKHSSASLTINENADPDVRTDFESHFNHMVPENAPYYVHTIEGPDDMPAHLKSSILGASVMIPITRGELNLGVWQGIYLCEHRDQGDSRKLVATIQGQLGN